MMLTYSNVIILLEHIRCTKLICISNQQRISPCTLIEDEAVFVNCSQLTTVLLPIYP
jgi:hypothetical protein